MLSNSLLVTLVAALGCSMPALAQNGTNSTYDVLQYVDQLIGSSDGGK
jgi:hypothetical protein